MMVRICVCAALAFAMAFAACNSGDSDTKQDIADTCTPDCDGKECGDDGCGGSCGGCSGSLKCIGGVCSAPCEAIGPLGCCAGGVAFMCWEEKLHESDCNEASTPFGAPSGKSHGLGWHVSCSTSVVGSGCGVNEPEVDTIFCPWCLPKCAGRDCGPDLCGGECGACGSGEKCLDGTCVPESCCDEDFACGIDLSCDMDCGECEQCGGGHCEDGVCMGLCHCLCSDRGCGSSGCGEYCSLCPPGMWCDLGFDGSHCTPPDPGPNS